jgi:ribonuclease-3
MRDEDKGPLGGIMEKIGYFFENPDLLTCALTHRSFANESADGIEDNQRLEFLGDAVLGLVVAEALMDRLPEAPEGILTKSRAALVNESILAELARDIDLGEALKLGRGEEISDGRNRSSTLCDAVEAVLGAVYLDGGFLAAKDVVVRWLGERLDEVADGVDVRDAKGALQEKLQADNRAGPVYNIVNEAGPDHAKTFEVEILVNGAVLAKGSGRSKKEAEKDAASRALKEMRS